ncbi:bifunctional adenosylcobinamide kinase/adenosylcobinamide-phosphate guanylyltransferase [Vreelandella sp. F11]|uniref:bifunctional adenosylcobinamide kinase/adenosylcobinamide-phosphate guanylyltransferase n=1 Tax=Vreelandella sp. F11 TaxID=3394751 RepID=UPI0036DAF254
MQLFIGGACAGKRDAVADRFPSAVWHRLAPGQRLAECQQALVADTPLVITGVFDWVEAALANAENDPARQQWQGDMTQLSQRADELNTALIIITTEVGRGIVPMQPDQRRLRDLNGWFSQDAAVQAEQVWYVRHGLVMAVK